MKNATTSHLESAYKYHFQSERHSENGDYGKATQSNIIAKEHLRLASEALVEEIHQHDMNNEIEID